MKMRLIIGVISFILISFVFCDNIMAQEYEDIKYVKYIKNYDGDTITVDIAGYPDIIGKNVSVRIKGIDTPEIKGDCVNEKFQAKLSRIFVSLKLKNAKTIIIKNPERGKYFRIVGDIEIDGRDLATEILEGGYGYSYDGGTKVNHWCEKND